MGHITDSIMATEIITEMATAALTATKSVLHARMEGTVMGQLSYLLFLLSPPPVSPETVSDLNQRFCLRYVFRLIGGKDKVDRRRFSSGHLCLGYGLMSFLCSLKRWTGYIIVVDHT